MKTRILQTILEFSLVIPLSPVSADFGLKTLFAPEITLVNPKINLQNTERKLSLSGDKLC